MGVSVMVVFVCAFCCVGDWICALIWLFCFLWCLRVVDGVVCYLGCSSDDCGLTLFVILLLVVVY